MAGEGCSGYHTGRNHLYYNKLTAFCENLMTTTSSCSEEHSCTILFPMMSRRYDYNKLPPRTSISHGYFLLIEGLVCLECSEVSVLDSCYRPAPACVPLLLCSCSLGICTALGQVKTIKEADTDHWVITVLVLLTHLAAAADAPMVLRRVSVPIALGSGFTCAGTREAAESPVAA